MPSSPSNPPSIEEQLTQRVTGLRALLNRQETEFEAEKSALAHELHADLGASLTALNMHLAILFRQMPEQDALQERMALIKTLTTSIAQSTRRLEARLRPDKLDSFGLKAAIGEQALAFTQRCGLACEASLPDEELAYPIQVDMALLRTVEEALKNVERHAQAKKVDVILDDNDDEIMLSIRDDGIGIPENEDFASKGGGLLSLHERALFLGGQLRIVTGPGKGTSVVIALSKAELPR